MFSHPVPVEPPELAQRLADDHGRGIDHIERALAGFHGNAHGRIGALADVIRQSGAFTSEQENVPFAKAESDMCELSARRQDHETSRTGGAKGREIRVPGQPRAPGIVHGRAPEAFVTQGKTGRFDDVQRQVEAGAEAHRRPEIARHVRFIHGKFDHAPSDTTGNAGFPPPRTVVYATLGRLFQPRPPRTFRRKHGVILEGVGAHGRFGDRIGSC